MSPETIRGEYVLVRLQCLEGAQEGAGNYITAVSWANDDGELEAVAPPCWPFRNESEKYVVLAVEEMKEALS